MKKNVVNVDHHIAQYAKIVEDLRGEISSLKERIVELENENETLKHNGGVERTIPRLSENQDMEVDSTNNEVPASADKDTVEANAMKIEEMQRTLNRYIERQKDFDEMQVKII